MGQNISSTVNRRVKVDALCCIKLTLSFLQQLWNDLHGVLCVAWRDGGLWRCRGDARRSSRWNVAPLCRRWIRRREQHLWNYLSTTSENTLHVNCSLTSLMAVLLIKPTAFSRRKHWCTHLLIMGRLHDCESAAYKVLFWTECKNKYGNW